MDRIEFLGKIEKGMIQIPQKYQLYENTTVEVSLKFKNASSDNKPKLAFKQYLNIFAQPIDGLAYQKKIRSDWE